MKSKVRISYLPKEKAEAIRLLNSGRSYSDVSREMGIPSGTMANWISKLGKNTKNMKKVIKIKKQNKYDEADKKYVVQLIDDTFSFKDASEQTGISITTIKKWYRDYVVKGKKSLTEVKGKNMVTEKVVSVKVCPICGEEIIKGKGVGHLQGKHSEYGFTIADNGSFICNACGKKVAPAMEKLFKHYQSVHLDKVILVHSGKSMLEDENPEKEIDEKIIARNSLNQVIKWNVELIATNDSLKADLEKANAQILEKNKEINELNSVIDKLVIKLGFIRDFVNKE